MTSPRGCRRSGGAAAGVTLILESIVKSCFAHTRQRVPFYLQVLRNFWRVFAWHVTTFAGILMLYAFLDEGLSPIFRLHYKGYLPVPMRLCN